MAKKDYYEVLGVSKNASDAEIKNAFRKLAREYHPDVSKDPNAEQNLKKFKKHMPYYQIKKKEDNTINLVILLSKVDLEELEVLTFQALILATYSLKSWFFFGFGSRTSYSNRPRTGRDVVIEMNISFNEAVFGTEKQLKSMLKKIVLIVMVQVVMMKRNVLNAMVVVL